MTALLQAQQSHTLADFKQRLKTEWQRHVACQDHCHDPKSHCPERHFVHVAALEAWWKRTASESTTQRKIDRLFDEMQLSEHGQLYSDSKTYANTCLRVLSILLDHDLGHLIKRFYDSNVHDMFLARGEGYSNLKANLQKTLPDAEVDRIIRTFHNAKWAYCPLDLRLHMDNNLQGTEVIVPFCRKVRLGEGGTASVYWVAVQKDLIRDDDLREALKQSLIIDRDYGECYQMALKSYRGNKESVYDLERNAFSGLNLNSNVPIVRCLGSYAHDYGEGASSSSDSDPSLQKTYNLLLEYGERDLYEYWADDTNIPPVRAEEIKCFWESLFEVAQAIRHVHNLEIPREKGPPRKFHGWHADVKPDNILIVHGQFKLADFGYSKFAPVKNTKKVPTEYIGGFTDTYGAPEVSRAKLPNGTVSEVTQSIDTWSFGCVLSVAATWVVLGFQGVRQYEKLRKLSKTNNKDGKIYDRFHNGLEALPEIRRWHDYLRGHLRRSDTMTPHVLRLVENNMLQANVLDRLQMTGLCKELEQLVRTAKTEIESLDEYSKDTDEAVLRALLEVENDAHREQSSRPKSTPLHATTLPSNQKDTLRPLQETSKTERLKSIPLGHTKYRTPIILKELGNSSVIAKDGEKSVGGTHEGATTESPVDEHPVVSLPERGRGPRQRNPVLHGSQRRSLAPQKGATGTSRHPRAEYQLSPTSNDHLNHSLGPLYDITKIPHSSNLYRGQESQVPIENWDDHAQSQRDIGKKHIIAQSERDQYRSSVASGYAERTTTSDLLPIQTQHNPTRKGLNMLTSAVTPFENPAPSVGQNRDIASKQPQHVNGAGWPTSRLPNGQDLPERHHRPFSEHAMYTAEPSSTPYRPGSLATTMQARLSDMKDQHILWLDNPSPRGLEFRNDRTYELNTSSSTQTSPASPQPGITITHPDEMRAGSSPATRQTSYYGDDKEAIFNAPPPHAEPLMSVPGSVYDLPYNVCHVREEVEAKDIKGVRASLKGLFGKEKRPADKDLAKTYGSGREIIFVIDNGATMFEHWPILVFVAETLAIRAAGLDKSGVDLIFTVGGPQHNKTRLKGDPGRHEFRKALDDAAPDTSGNLEHETDLYETLDGIIKAWKKNGHPPTTLLILTDGAWKRSLPNTVDDVIINVAQIAQKISNNSNAGKRPFGIQFIRFGETERAKLEKLDNELCKERRVRDIIDHCSWRSTVEKMFKGSIDGQHDQQDPVELDIMYSYKDLVDLFRRSNKILDSKASATSSGHLAPSSSQLTPSRSSSSASVLRWRDSSPLENRTDQRRRDSWQSHSRQPMSM